MNKMTVMAIQFFRLLSPSWRRQRKFIDKLNIPEWFKGYLLSGSHSVDEYLSQKGYKKFLVKRRSPTSKETWFIIISKEKPKIGGRLERCIGPFSTLILNGEIVEVRPYNFWEAQELGATDKYCRQCRQQLTPENDFGLVDIVGYGGRGYCSESCLRLSREA